MTTNNALSRSATWSGRWISHPEDVPEPGGPLVQAERITEYTRRIFTKSFRLSELPVDPVMAKIFADSRYVLLVNGKTVGRGPIRSQPRRSRYDEYDILPFLVEGENEVEVQVTYYGSANSFWQPASPNGLLGAGPLLVFDAEVAGVGIGSDESWTVRRVESVRAASGVGFHGVPVEVVDTRADEEPAQLVQATVVSAQHFGSLARAVPPTDPYGPLLRRPIGFLDESRETPTHAASLALPSEASFEKHPVQAVLTALTEAGGAAFDQIHPDAAAISFVLPESGQALLKLDFGRVVLGRTEMQTLAPRGTRFDLMYSERAPRTDVTQSISPVTGATFITHGGEDCFTATESNGLRYAFILITGQPGSEVKVEQFAVQEWVYPYSGEASFVAEDEELVRLYNAGRRTVTLNSTDAFTDCPTREQRAWVGDGVVHQMVHLTSSTDWRLANRYTDLGNSPRYDGMLPRSVVGDMEYDETVAIPDWAMNWIHGIYNLFMYEGVTDVVTSALPTAERVLRWYLPYVADDGLIENVPEWNLTDWSAVYVNGKSSIVNSMWARGLNEFALMSEHVGNAASAKWAREAYDQAKASFDIFWDDERGTYVDHLVDGIQSLPASQMAGASAVVSGLANERYSDRIASWIGTQSHLVKRSWIGGNGGYDDAKIERQLQGIQVPDWDVVSECVRAEPFGSYIVHDAMAQLGRFDMLREDIRNWDEFLVDGYDTFGECWGWGTPVHGWSSSPTRSIIQYLVGVIPAEPGFNVARVCPQLSLLGDFSATVPVSPYEYIRITSKDGVVNLETPIPVVFIPEFGDDARLEPGTHVLPRK